MQMLTARLVFCYCLYWGRFSTGELFVVELLGNEDIVRICIPCSSPPPPTCSVPVTEQCRDHGGPLRKQHLLECRRLLFWWLSHTCQLVLKQKVKPSRFKNKGFSGTTMHWWSTLVLLSASSPVLRARWCLSFALDFPPEKAPGSIWCCWAPMEVLVSIRLQVDKWKLSQFEIYGPTYYLVGHFIVISCMLHKQDWANECAARKSTLSHLD